MQSDFLHNDFMMIGIDLGTTNSLVSVWRDGDTVLIPNSLGQILTPSVVSLDRSGEIMVGAAARERLISHPDLTIANFKRYMGSDRSIALGSRNFRPEELSSFVLRALKSDAEVCLGQKISEAVITAPAYFNDAQRKAIKAAGELAGLKVERVLNEPTAAALAYGLETITDNGKILVFDLGGGTFDVSIVELSDGIVEVRATAGDNYLGGIDFDDAIVTWFVAQTGADIFTGYSQNVEKDRALRRLREEACRARHALGTAGEAEIILDYEGKTHRATLTEAGLESLCTPLLDRLCVPVTRALRDSRIRPGELSHIVLAGGATRMRIVRKLVARLFNRLPLQHVNPDEVVARGAAVQAGLKMRDQALRDIVLTDVAPYTLGVEVVETDPDGRMTGGRFLPIIERNTVVPVSRVERLTPVADFAKKVTLRIFQGESRLVKDNIALGEMTLTLHPARRGDQAVEARFTYDINGILEVVATSLKTVALERMVIERTRGVLTSEEIALRLEALSALKLSPRDQAGHRFLLAQAERWYEQSLGDDRKALSREMAHFEAALDGQHPERIKEAADSLRLLLQKLEYRMVL